MSAFLCDDLTVNKIVTHLQTRMNRNNGWLPRQILEMTGHDPDTPDGAKAIGQKLRKANLDALNARYGEDDESALFTYKFTASLTTTKVEAAKAAHCLRYQCSEGDVMESETGKMIELICRSFDSAVVHSLPEYDAAPWG